MNKRKQIRFPDDLLERLESQSKLEDRSFSWLVRHYCEQGLNEEELLRDE